ncbi:MAG: heme biosynthesis protein HemY [Rhodoferax sp.]|nr:heme biosynthesis protein HemY [Rhodoferax sp.]
MRAALWFLALFGIAAAIALFAGNNQGTVTLFWPPYRVDVSLNLVLLLLAVLFFTLHTASRALSALFAIPGQARRWRLQHQERAMHMAMLDSLSHLVGGRFIRARKAAELALAREAALSQGGDAPAHCARLRVLSHLLAAESAQALQDHAARQTHFQAALEQADRRDAQDTRDAVQMRGARWALEDRDAAAALRWIDTLPQGAGRRTIALRLRLEAARLGRRTPLALETARLLAKHRAFSQEASGLTDEQRLELVRVLENGFALAGGAPETAWLTRIETAQLANPRDAALQYLAGISCMRLQLWGKAQQLLTQSLSMLQDPGLQRNAWRALAELAERRDDSDAAIQAWRNAAKR